MQAVILLPFLVNFSFLVAMSLFSQPTVSARPTTDIAHLSIPPVVEMVSSTDVHDALLDAYGTSLTRVFKYVKGITRA